MKIRYWIYFIVIVLSIWQLSSMLIDNVFILPAPYSVLMVMIDLLKTPIFFVSILTTLFRALVSIIISFIVAAVLSLISLKHQYVSNFIEKVVLILRSIPNVTYVILLLFWVSREITVFIVSFLLLFPIIYQNLLESLKEIDNKWKDVLKVYPQSLSTTYKRVYFPLMKPAISSSLVSASSLAFKVGVMAEILGQVHTGVGRQIQLAKLNVDLTSVLAWTIWLVLCVFIFDWIIKRILRPLNR